MDDHANENANANDNDNDDELDRRIHDMLTGVVADAPDAPDLTGRHEPTVRLVPAFDPSTGTGVAQRRHSIAAALVIAAVVAAAIVAVVVVRRDPDDPDRSTSPSTSLVTTTTAPTSTSASVPPVENGQWPTEAVVVVAGAGGVSRVTSTGTESLLTTPSDRAYDLGDGRLVFSVDCSVDSDGGCEPGTFLLGSQGTLLQILGAGVRMSDVGTTTYGTSVAYEQSHVQDPRCTSEPCATVSFVVRGLAGGAADRLDTQASGGPAARLRLGRDVVINSWQAPAVYVLDGGTSVETRDAQFLSVSDDGTLLAGLIDDHMEVWHRDGSGTVATIEGMADDIDLTAHLLIVNHGPTGYAQLYDLTQAHPKAVDVPVAGYATLALTPASP